MVTSLDVTRTGERGMRAAFRLTVSASDRQSNTSEGAVFGLELIKCGLRRCPGQPQANATLCHSMPSAIRGAPCLCDGRIGLCLCRLDGVADTDETVTLLRFT